MKSIHERIKEERLLLKWSQEKLAKEAGVTKTAISRWELGLNAITGKNLVNLAKIFKCTPEYLESGEGESVSSIVSWVPILECQQSPLYSPEYFDIKNVSDSFFPVPNAVLAEVGVSFDQCLCIRIHDDCMASAFLSGSVIAIDRNERDIRNGKMYAVYHGGLLRVRKLYRTPYEVKVESSNDLEVYSIEQAADMKILGRVFWGSSIY